MFYWPSFDIALYGYVSTWIACSPTTPCTAVTAIVFWHAMLQASFAIAKNFLSELTTGGITNLFATTLSLREWITGCAMLAACISIVVFGFCSLVSYAVFGCYAFALGWPTLPILANLMLSALTLGLLSATLLSRYGLRVQATIFIIGWALALASGAYYPIGLLPDYVQSFARLTPLPYLFEIIRNPDASSTVLIKNLGTATILTLCCFLLLVVIFRRTFVRAKRHGLAQLTF